MTTLTEPDAELAGCLAVIGATFTELFHTLDRWRSALAGEPWPTAGPTAERLDRLTRSLVEEELSQPGAAAVGAGFVARPGWITDAPWHLAWWLGEAGTPTIRRLAVNVDPTSESFRDYTGLEWWQIPERTGGAHITGPYVDYLCTDEYTLTLTAPVHVRQEFVGVVGVDIYVKTIEAIVLPRLRRLGSRATVVNSAGRVVASTDPHRAAGSILRIDGLPDLVRNCPGTTLGLLFEGVSPRP